MKRLLTISVLATAGVLAGAAGASAADYSYDGSCDVTGVATFTKPLTNTSQQNHYDFVSGKPDATEPDATKCTGTLGTPNGPVEIDTTKVKVSVGGDGDLSCSHSQSGDPGPGTLTFTEPNITVGFTLGFVGFATEVSLDVRGQKSGQGAGRASFGKYVDPGEAVTKCQDPAQGLKQLGFEANFHSLSPLVGPGTSDSTGGGSGGGSGGGGGTGGGSGGGTGGTGGGGGGPSGGGVTKSNVSIAGPAQKLAKAIKKGIAVTLKGNVPAKATLKAQLSASSAKRYGLGRKAVTIAKGIVQLKSGGQTTGYLKLTAAAKRKLKGKHRVKVKLVGTILDVTGRKQSVSKNVTLT